MCASIGVQVGIPENRTRNSLIKTEEDFWKDFFQQADEEFSDARESRFSGGVIIPSPSLIRKYQIAVTQYGTEKRFEMEQLECLFNWSLVL